MIPDADRAIRERLAVFDNGYVPLPNRCKVCHLPKWQRLVVTPDEIRGWSRLMRLPDTGIRLDGDLLVLDFDVDADLVQRIFERVFAEVPVLRRALVRAGKGQKEAWFCRTTSPVGRLSTRKYADPLTGHSHQLEMFGSQAARQFGAFGAHTRDETGQATIQYRWLDDRSPATVSRSALPVLSGAEVHQIITIAEAEFSGAGWAPEPSPHRAKNAHEYRVFDLTDQMRFACNDGWTYSLADLTALKGDRGLRCSASFRGERASNETRCLIGWSPMHKCVTVWDAQECVTHLPKANKPPTFNDLAAALRRLQTASLTPNNLDGE